MKVLIAGGAGFIGSTVASAVLDAGDTPVIVDNLVTGRREFTAGRAFYEGDISDSSLIDTVFSEQGEIHASILCAALINVPESVAEPIVYYLNNVSKSLSFVSHLIRNGCSRLIFSSSASIYASEDGSEVDEDTLLQPLSPYARTKATCELMLQDVASAEDLRVLSLRYFNPIGADPKMRTGLQLAHPNHALGKVIDATETNVPFEITGVDYPTRDGSGMRDYIHVWDVAQAHISALRRFDDIVSSQNKYEAINLGTGRGTTVRELVDTFNEVSKQSVTTVEGARRPGDTAGSYASNAKAQILLNWTPRFSLEDGIRDSLKWSEVRRELLGE
jgi:UDP-glucose 4-epimerase